MSTKTNFKRIALVAVAALGLGVLSSVPSQAASQSISLTTTNGTATTALADSTTAGSVTLSFINSDKADTFLLRAVLESSPTGNTVLPTLLFSETSNATVDTNISNNGDPLSSRNKIFLTHDLGAVASDTDLLIGATGAVGTAVNARAKLFIQLASAPSQTGTYRVKITAVTTGKTDTITAYSDIVATTATTSSLTANAGFSTAVLSSGSSDASNLSTAAAYQVDSTVVAVATAANTASAVIQLVLRNSSNNTAARESVTVTTNIGSVGDGTNMGRSVVLAYPTTNLLIQVRPDGTAGVAEIKISTPSVTFATKKVTFYSATVSKIVNTKLTSVIGAGSTSAVLLATATDSAGNLNAADDAVYAYSSDTSVISTYGTACTYNSTYGGQLCSLTGVKSGKANITLRDAATVALSTVASSAVEVVVNTNPAATVKLTTNKASYAPGEKAFVILTAYDASGAVAPALTTAALLSSAGVTTDAALGTGSADLVTGATAITTASSTGTGGTYASADPVKQWTVYMPVNGSKVTFTAKGGTLLPAAGQVTLTATATVTDNAAAALAAVSALATTVASLKTLITTLTNLVLKIQKKVKA
jgi:hypothetical protein